MGNWGHAEMNWVGHVLEVNDAGTDNSAFAGKTNIYTYIHTYTHIQTHAHTHTHAHTYIHIQHKHKHTLSYL